MSKKFVNLLTEPSNITQVMAGPWQDIRVDVVAAGATLDLNTETLEHSCFVIDGVAELINGDGRRFELIQNSAFSLPAGGSATVRATTQARLLHIEMRLPA
ncbi:hypothetical protein ACFQ68_00315 [Amycolatopsis japonica]|uniref:hypothetical protein n=1 Tax=Amycolatopsis japonica TaxID=208439 RepID=UPI00366D7912